jgi:cytidylate kinase
VNASLIRGASWSPPGEFDAGSPKAFHKTVLDGRYGFPAMIVTIDGPAGAGKSSVARRLAQLLGFRFLDTGAMYRAVTLAGMRQGTDPDDPAALQRLLESIRLSVEDGVTTINGIDVSTEIRSPEVTREVRRYSQRPAVREFLAGCQRAYASGRDLVTEGRDQGTVVFPKAECKFFLTAQDAVRAQRRQDDFNRQGRAVALDQILVDIQTRDRQDQERALAPLVPAEDAQIVDTSNLSLDEVVAILESAVRARIPAAGAPPVQTENAGNA